MERFFSCDLSEDELSVLTTPSDGVSGKMNRGDWRFHYPNTLPQRMTSLSLLACSFAFTAEMYSDFAESFQAWTAGDARTAQLLSNTLFLAIGMRYVFCD